MKNLRTMAIIFATVFILSSTFVYSQHDGMFLPKNQPPEKMVTKDTTIGDWDITYFQPPQGESRCVWNFRSRDGKTTNSYSFTAEGVLIWAESSTLYLDDRSGMFGFKIETAPEMSSIPIDVSLLKDWIKKE